MKSVDLKVLKREIFSRFYIHIFTNSVKMNINTFKTVLTPGNDFCTRFLKRIKTRKFLLTWKFGGVWFWKGMIPEGHRMDVTPTQKTEMICN